MFKIFSLFGAICMSVMVTAPHHSNKVNPGFSKIGGEGSLLDPINPSIPNPSSSSRSYSASPSSSSSSSSHLSLSKPSSSSSTSSLKPPSSFNDISGYFDYFSCERYGPFHVGDNNINITFDYRAKIANQTIIERIRLLSNNSVVYGSSKEAKYYSNNEEKTVTFTLPIRDYLSVYGLTLKFEILNTNYDILKSYYSSFYPLMKPDVSYIYLKNNPLLTNSIAFYGDGVSMKEAKELFDFTSLDDYIDVDYYYRLKLDSFRFKYDSIFLLDYSSVSLVFEDHDYLFPYLSHDNGDNIIVPLDIYKKGDYYYVKFSKSFYINKRTLQISETYREGFVMTKDFYLPVNGRKRFNDKTLYFALTDLGQCDLSVTFPLHYSVDKSLVGLCNDGLHCIGGGSR